MKITAHFDSQEFGCKDGTPYPLGWMATRLLPLCELLEAIRSHVRAPIRIVSGYRTESYNRHIGDGFDTKRWLCEDCRWRGALWAAKQSLIEETERR